MLPRTGSYKGSLEGVSYVGVQTRPEDFPSHGSLGRRLRGESGGRGGRKQASGG